jgi:hypothetical protein
MTDDATTAVRRITIEINQATSDALNRRTTAEGLNPSTLFNRAMQVYDRDADHEWRCPNCGATTRARMADH